MKPLKVLLVICSVITVFHSCKKENVLKFEKISKIKFSHKLLDNVPLTIKVDGKLFADKGLTGLNSEATFSLKSGKHSFAFYDASEQVVLDTTLSVTGALEQFDLFRPDAITPVVFLNEKTLGLDTEPAPKPGYFKIKIANFTADSIDVIFSANDQFFMKVPIDTIHNVSKNLKGGFFEIELPTQVSGGPVGGYTFDAFDLLYQLNYGDYGVNINTFFTLQSGKTYVAYLNGGAAFGGYELRPLYEK